MIAKRILALAVVASGVATSYAACNNNCNGHGTCGTWDKCTCYHSWDYEKAEDCSMRVCPYGQAPGVIGSTVHAYKECSESGVCNRQSGECECYEGYTGHACQRLNCKDDCSGHGECQTLRTHNFAQGGGYSADNWDANQVMICKCDPGFEGPSCEFRMCPKGDDPLSLNSILGGSQVDEVQVCKILGTTLGGTFVLQFTDWTGQVHNTWPLTGVGLTQIAVEEALQALPNNVIPDVEVSIDNNIDSDISFKVTFTASENSGPQTIMEILTDNHAAAGHQPVYALTGTLTSASCSTSATGGAVGTEESKVCAGRGSCDAETGLCICNTGFYGHSCNQQTALQ